jgi:hypothetical protein
MAFSSVSVVTNSLSLKRYNPVKTKGSRIESKTSELHPEWKVKDVPKEGMLKFEEKIKLQDNKLEELETQNRELNTKFSELSKKSEDINDMKLRIAEVLIKTQQMAGNILEEARKQAVEEKTHIQLQIESEKEKLSNIKQDVRVLKKEILNKLKTYEQELDDISGEDIN